MEDDVVSVAMERSADLPLDRLRSALDRFDGLLDALDRLFGRLGLRLRLRIGLLREPVDRRERQPEDSEGDAEKAECSLN
jgi:hypothetical protein